MQCPRISAAFLEEERRQLGNKWFRQEYMCEFDEDENRMFPRELVRAALDDDLEPMEFDGEIVGHGWTRMSTDRTCQKPGRRSRRAG